MTWPLVALRDVAEIERISVSPSEIAGGTRYVGLEHIESGGQKLTYAAVANGELSSNKFRFGPSHVLFGKLRPYLAKIVCPDFEGICSTDILPIAPGRRVHRRYLLHYLQLPRIVDWAASRATGINLPRLSPSQLSELEIPIPPLDEQRRIAAILDKADALRRKRRQALDLLDSLTQSIFLEMFGDLTSSSRYPRGTIGDWVEDFEAGRNLAPDADSKRVDGRRVLKVSAVTSGIFDPDESKPLPADYLPPDGHRVRTGDLLFSRANTADLIGATAYVAHLQGNIFLTDKIWRFRWQTKRQPQPLFIHALFSSAPMRRAISKRATGTSGSMKNISKFKVLEIGLALPSREAQDEFVRRLEVTSAIRSHAKDQLSYSESLYSSLQSRAFSGQL